MRQQTTPARHLDPWVNLPIGYMTAAVAALMDGGLRVTRSWLDPRGPRDATILCSTPADAMMAIVWDEVTGWRHGTYLSGHQGVRTELAGARYLGGGVLLDVREVSRRIVEGVSESPQQYRSIDDLRDGLDDALTYESSLLG